MSEVQDDVRTFAEKAEDGMSDKIAPGQTETPLTDALDNELVKHGRYSERERRLLMHARKLERKQSATAPIRKPFMTKHCGWCDRGTPHDILTIDGTEYTQCSECGVKFTRTADSSE